METDTASCIKNHIKSVQRKLSVLIKELQNRLENHDRSKLEDELWYWEFMDQEPKYPYGSKEYFSKIKRNEMVFKIHYKKNRHHPEHFMNGINDMNLIDIMEMLCDWISYKDDISITDAVEVVEKQSRRFGFSDELKNILLNTLFEYFAKLRMPSEEHSVPMLNEEIPMAL